MTPFHWQSHHGNFGDDLNLWLWDYLLPGFRDVHPDVLLVGVGTVLNDSLLPAGRRKLVVGSGFGYGTAPDIGDPAQWDIRCVRGPLTAGKLGLDAEYGIIDPAVMVTEMPEFANLPETRGTIFVPHWESTVGGLWPDLCRLTGIGYVDPCGEAKSVIRAIAQAKLVVAESMHAAILADAFRIPWVPVTTSASINSFKWRDWAASLDLAYAPHRIPLSSRAEAITKGARFWGKDYAGRTHTTDAAEGNVAIAERVDARQEDNGLRQFTKQVLAGPAALALWRAQRARPILSDHAVLADRKNRLRDRLEEVRRDYL